MPKPSKPRNPIANQLRAETNQQKVIPNKKTRKTKRTNLVLEIDDE